MPIPENMQSLIDHIGIFIPDDVDDDVREVLIRGAEGRCMACEVELGTYTKAVVGQEGIIAIYCGGACLTDHQVIGWMEEEHADIVQRVEFRGSQPDEADQQDPLFAEEDKPKGNGN